MHAVTLTGGRCTVYSDLASKEALLGAIVADCFLTLGGVTIVEPVRSLQLAQKTYRVFRQRRRGLARWLEDARLMVDDPTGRVKQFLGLTKAFALRPQILGGQRVPDGAERTPILDSTVAILIRQCVAANGFPGQSHTGQRLRM